MTLLAFRGRPHAANRIGGALIPGLAGLLCLVNSSKAFARPDWIVPYGREFWQPPPSTDTPGLLSAGRSSQTNFARADLGTAIDRVRHAFQPDGSTDSWQAADPAFRVRVNGDGIEFKSGATSDALRINVRTRAIGMIDANSISTTSIASASPWAVTGNVAQRRLNTSVPVVEHLQTRANGLEVTWVLDQPPTGDGNLIIDWGISGGGIPETTDHGWRFAGRTPHAGIRIGDAQAADSKGRRRTLQMRRTPTGFAIELPEEFLKTATYPIAIDPLISSEFDLDQPVPRSAPSAQFAPAIASDGTNYLVVWHDNRNVSQLNIYGARVTTNGTVLDPSGFAIGTGTNDQWYPAVAFNGDNFLVAWQDARNGGQDIYASRVTPDGQVLETNGLPVVKAANDQRLPAVASLNGDFLVTWQDGRNGTANQDIYAARIKGGGLLVETNGFVVSNAANSQSAPSVSVVGTNYVVAWHDFRSGVGLDVYAARITAAGTVLDGTGIPISTAANDQWNVSIAGNGDTGLITWQDGRNGTDDDIFGARINAAGSVLDPNGIAISQQTGQQRFPTVAPLGSDFYVTWQDSRAGSDFNLYGTRVSAAGTVTSSTGTLISDAVNDQRYPAVALSAGQLLIVWEDIRNGSDAEIYASRIDTSGTSLDGGNLLVSTVSNTQETPAVASNGSIYLAVWRDYRNDPLGDIYGSRIAADGTVLDPTGLAICTAGNYQQAPRVASSGSDFLVVWQDFRNGVHDDIMGARVTSSGAILDPNGLSITTAVGAQRQPAVAGNANGYLVVWQDRRTGSSDDIYGARVGTDGTVQDANGLPICTVALDQKSPAVAGLNNTFFVAWEDFRSGVSNRVYGTRILSDGQIATADGFALSALVGEQQAPRIAASTNQYFVVWQGQTNAADFGVFGTRISESGIVADTNSITISNSTGDQTHPAIASKQGDFMAVWEDQRTAGRTNLFACRITANGTVLEPAGELTVPDTGKYRLPAIANVGSDYLLVYQTPDAGNIQRVRGVIQYPTAEPTISLSPGAAQFVAGSGPVAIDPAAVLVDGTGANFESGTLTVDIPTNATVNDRLSIANQGNGAGQVGVSGNQVSYGGTLIGFLTGGTSGSSPLLIIFSAAATADAVEALARGITFDNIAAQPFTQPRTIRFALSLTSGAGQPTTRTLNVVDAGSVPQILTQPAGQTAGAGGDITLSVVATGSQPITYQWRLNGTNIIGATNADYTITGLQSETAGDYSVAVGNAYDTVISDVASVTYFDIAMYAGLTIAGPVGAIYEVDYRPAVGDNSSWTTLTNITLVASPQLFFDPDSSRQNQRFYRAIRQQ